MTTSKVVMDKGTGGPKFEVCYNTDVQVLEGNGKGSGVTTRNCKTGDSETINPAGTFVFIGLTPNVAWLPEGIKRDKYGFIVTAPTLETSMRGVFAAADIR
jgi:thioredoxin reductase (NADPH)